MAPFGALRAGHIRASFRSIKVKLVGHIKAPIKSHQNSTKSCAKPKELSPLLVTYPANPALRIHDIKRAPISTQGRHFLETIAAICCFFIQSLFSILKLGVLRNKKKNVRRSMKRRAFTYLFLGPALTGE
jgi:hypothetical protein